MTKKNMKTVSSSLSVHDFDGPWTQVIGFIEAQIEAMGIDPDTACLDPRWEYEEYAIRLSGERPMTEKEKAAAMRKRERERVAKKKKDLQLKKKQIVDLKKSAKALKVPHPEELDTALEVVEQELKEFS